MVHRAWDDPEMLLVLRSGAPTEHLGDTLQMVLAAIHTLDQCVHGLHPDARSGCGDGNEDAIGAMDGALGG